MTDTPLVLAIDTSTDMCVGVASGDTVLATRRDDDRRAHVEHLAARIREVLAEAGASLGDLTDIVVGLGPGPFTGLRVGIATAETLAWAGNVRLHGVCSLDVVAYEHAHEHQPEADFVVAADARRKELYWARYAADGSRVGEPQVSVPAALPDLVVVGPGADLYPLVHHGRVDAGPRALDPGLLARVGLGLPSAGDQPLYLRRPDAVAPTTRKSALVSHKRLTIGRA
ncbi:tRNA (adenosine(37)-N6)-threonylcarbamoyltransferase complex dimerization subunit type 1 TsaB [Raineyella fluvialis]|uniref:tRNA (Adenosine(37)-N6)-threonylcarbamoyltransferase complex dimerization subunit type 1 TsaB n=1 Tax=Raineyella fluvialis TaxID=2662261 RepID=A0A5Q2FBA9_9ACTN|nr:tRNA (adenosine(37)-N6)-threonylcarbamoyltransferase complex dimerization subunit type 1 TsaB [Raineyella fluvialis]QGF22694.1 tRNA (adenosine(37)-N6)-threonylcarbamoyltransferase complex dimerization subunit type 1 TsaB [Raineyella fluvialis]